MNRMTSLRMFVLISTVAACEPAFDGLTAGNGDGDAGEASTSAAAPASDASDGGSVDGTAGPRKTDLWFRTWGDPKAPAVILLHGGPGATAVLFEYSIAEPLAARGFHVVAYDQRGSGRSPKGTAADYSYARFASDLEDLSATLGLTKPVLVGHSFGGTVALHAIELRPALARGVVVLGSPLDAPMTYQTILQRCAAVYQERWMAAKAKAVTALEAKMFPNGLTPPFTYGGEEIGGVIGCMRDLKLDMLPVPSLDFTKVAAKMAVADLDNFDLVSVNVDVGEGLHTNDRVGYMNHIPLLAKHKAHAFAIYSDKDQMFSAEQRAAIANAVGEGRYAEIANAAHFFYADRIDETLDVLVKDLNALP